MKPKLRVAFLTDLHVREADLVLHSDLLRGIVDQITAFAPHVIFLGGDLAGLQVPHKASVRERNLIARTVAALASVAPLVAVRGNHDFPGDYQFLGHFPNVTWVEGDPGLVLLDTSVGVPVGVLALPWLDRSRFPVGADYAEAVRSVYCAAAKSSAADLESVRREGGRCFILGHLAALGGSLRPGQPTVPTEDPTIELASIPGFTVFDAGFYGHYHSPQDLLPRHRYGGSAFINEFGEEPVRGWTSWSDGVFEHIAVVQPRRVVVEYAAASGAISSIRPMLVGRSPKTVAEFARDPPESAVVKLVSHVPSAGALPAAREEAARYIGALASHGVEAQASYETVHSERSRAGAAATAAATTMSDKFMHWVASLDAPPSATALARAEELLAALDSGIDSGPSP